MIGPDVPRCPPSSHPGGSCGDIVSAPLRATPVMALFLTVFHVFSRATLPSRALIKVSWQRVFCLSGKQAFNEVGVLQRCLINNLDVWPVSIWADRFVAVWRPVMKPFFYRSVPFLEFRSIRLKIKHLGTGIYIYINLTNFLHKWEYIGNGEMGIGTYWYISQTIKFCIQLIMDIFDTCCEIRFFVKSTYFARTDGRQETSCIHIYRYVCICISHLMGRVQVILISL